MEWLAQVRHKIRKKRNSIRAEQAYVEWIRRFIIVHSKRHVEDRGKREISQDLSRSASDLKIAESIQTGALCDGPFLQAGARG